jgi:antitoxin Phd
MQTWQLHQAKNRFSEVVDNAVRKGPQVITRHGVETAVLLSVEEYRKLQKPKTSLVEFFRASPLVGVELDLERSEDVGREVDL